MPIEPKFDVRIGLRDAHVLIAALADKQAGIELDLVAVEDYIGLAPVSRPTSKSRKRARLKRELAEVRGLREYITNRKDNHR